MKITFGKSYEEDNTAIRDCREVINAMEDNADINDAPIASWDSAGTAFDVYEREPSETGLAIVESFITGADPEPMLDDWHDKICEHDYPEEERVFELQYTVGSELFTGWVTKLGADEYTAFIGDLHGILDRLELTKSEYRAFVDKMNELFDYQPEYDFNSIYEMRRFVFFGDFEHTEEAYKHKC
jgi:hypothetical protein